MLKDAEILYERGVFPDSTYIFKHALTREVVYESILSKRRKDLHRDIGDSIEELYRDNLDEYSEILAEHYTAGVNYLRGSDYYRMTVRKATKAFSFVDAIAHAENCVACLEKLPRTIEMEKKLIDARTTLGLYFVQQLNFSDAKKAIDPIVDLVLKHDYKRRLPRIYTISCSKPMEDTGTSGFRR